MTGQEMSMIIEQLIYNTGSRQCVHFFLTEVTGFLYESDYIVQSLRSD